MTTSPDTHTSHDSGDVVSLLNALAEAADSRAFFATLCRALPVFRKREKRMMRRERPEERYPPKALCCAAMHHEMT